MMSWRGINRGLIPKKYLCSCPTHPESVCDIQKRHQILRDSMAILTFMQNQTEMGKVIMMNRKDMMVKSHSQTPRPGDFTPREKPNRIVLEEDCSQNTDSLTNACTHQLHCCPLPWLIANEPLGSLWRWLKEHSLLQIARSCKDGGINCLCFTDKNWAMLLCGCLTREQILSWRTGATKQGWNAWNRQLCWAAVPEVYLEKWAKDWK